MLDVDLDVDDLTALDGAFADHFAVAAHRDLGALAANALVVEPVGDGLGLSDDAETRRGRNRDTAGGLGPVGGGGGRGGRPGGPGGGGGGGVRRPGPRVPGSGGGGRGGGGG